MSDYIPITPQQQARLRKRIEALRPQVKAAWAEAEMAKEAWHEAMTRRSELSDRLRGMEARLRGEGENLEILADRAKRVAKHEKEKALRDYAFQRAANQRQWWTPDEDEILMSDPRSNFDLALALGRTLGAVKTRRGLLRNGKIEYKSASSVRRQTRTRHMLDNDKKEAS